MPLLNRALLVARTVRHLTPGQLAFQVLRRAFPPSARPVAGPPQTAARLPSLAAAMARWADVQEPSNLARANDVVQGRFTFLNHTESLSVIDWTQRYVSHLWSYNLHYFEYAVDLALAYRSTGDTEFAGAFARLSTDWIDGTANGTGDGWEPYALSMRVVHWTYALLLFGDALDPEVRRTIMASLHRQLDVLSRRLEWHILANHLQKNLHALLVGSLLFDDADAVRWRDKALTHHWRQLEEQVLADGVHFERAPMYHALALVDYAEDILLLDAAGMSVPVAAREHIREMAVAMERFVRPDDTLSLFNDTAMGIAKPVTTLRAITGLVFPVSPPSLPGSWALPASGYFGLRTAEVSLVVDCGAPGPSYQPGHAHCDILSYELDVLGHPLVVDAGVHGYDGDPYRRYVRSTRAHNTVMIGGREQSEIWSTFRMARRATVTRAELEATRDDFAFHGAYRSFHDRRILHARTIRASAATFEVTDTVQGAIGEELESYIHLHPDCVMQLDGERATIESPFVRADIVVFGADEVSAEHGVKQPMQGWFFPQFGAALPNHVIVMRVRRNEGRPFGYRITWHSR